MTGMQQQILERVRRRIEGVGLTYVLNEQSANMGTVRAMRDLEVVLRLDFDFQDQYGRLTFSGPLVERQAERLDLSAVYGVRDPNPLPRDVPRDRAWQSSLQYDDVRSLERPMCLLADLLPEQPKDSREADTDINPRRAQAPADPSDVEALLAANWDGDGAGQWRNDDSPHDNTRRAGFAGQAVIAYADATRHGTGSEVDVPEVIGDLLGDLRHLCDALGLDFDALSEDGRERYDAELRGE